MSRISLLILMGAACMIICLSSIKSQPPDEQNPSDDAAGSADDPTAVGAAPEIDPNAIVGERRKLLEDLLSAVELTMKDDVAVVSIQQALQLQQIALDAAVRADNDADRRLLEAMLEGTQRQLREARTQTIHRMLRKLLKDEPIVKYVQ